MGFICTSRWTFSLSSYIIDSKLKYLSHVFRELNTNQVDTKKMHHKKLSSRNWQTVRQTGVTFKSPWPRFGIRDGNIGSEVPGSAYASADPMWSHMQGLLLRHFLRFVGSFRISCNCGSSSVVLQIMVTLRTTSCLNSYIIIKASLNKSFFVIHWDE